MNLLVGGSAGQGMDTLASMFEKILKKLGFNIFSTRDYMSRVRGGHNFIQIRFSKENLTSHDVKIDTIIALDEDTINNHIINLHENGTVICDDKININDTRIIKLPLTEMAKEIGNSKMFGSIALGATLKLFNLTFDIVEETVLNLFNENFAKINTLAIQKGYTLVSPKYSINSEYSENRILINGNQAIALGALASNCKFYSAYPMTPSTSIMNYLASKINDAEIVVEQAEDEISAINMAIGASYAGVRAMTGTSGGGFCLMTEAVGLSGMAEIPIVIADIQRPGPVTGLPTRTEQGDLRFVISSSHGEFPKMVIALKNPEDAFFQTIRAFEIADKYRIPVIILGDQYLADSITTVPSFNVDNIKLKTYTNNENHSNDLEFKTYELTDTGISDRIIPCKIPGKVVKVYSDEHDEYGNITESAEIRIAMTNKRLNKFKHLENELIEPEFIGIDNCDILLLAWGSLQGPIIEAINLLNGQNSNKYGALIFGDIWPLPTKTLTKKAKRVKQIINVEQNATGQLASLIMEVTGIKCTKSVLRFDGRPMSYNDIYSKLTGGSLNGQ